MDGEESDQVGNPKRTPTKDRHARLFLDMAALASLLLAIPPHVVVVGGGIGGLAIAARLADDCRVTILEQGPRVGGRCGSFLYDGQYRHERGPSLLLLPEIYQELFDDCGAEMSDYGLDILRCDPAYQVVFEDGDRVSVGFADPESSEAQESRRILDSMEDDGAEKFDQYLEVAKSYLDCGLPNFIQQRLDLGSFPAFIKSALLESWPLQSHKSMLDRFFDSDKLKALASFQDLYVGLSPYGSNILRTTAPAVFALLASIELHPDYGVFAPRGGFQAVTDAVARLAVDRGVSIQCDSRVTDIASDGVWYIQRDNSEATFMEADRLVVNADLPYATATLFRGERQRELFDWDDKYQFSSGVIAFHWSISKPLVDLDAHNVFLTANHAEESWLALVQDTGREWVLQDNSPVNFYVHRASKTDDTAAPRDGDTLLVLVPCPTLKRDPALAALARDDALQQYASFFDNCTIDRVRRLVLSRLGSIESLQDLADAIRHETVDTPGTYAADYNVAAGTPFAISHGLAQLSLTRPGFTSSKYPNAFFVGAGTRPGNGVPLVLTSAELCAQAVLKSLPKAT